MVGSAQALSSYDDEEGLTAAQGFSSDPYKFSFESCYYKSVSALTENRGTPKQSISIMFM